MPLLNILRPRGGPSLPASPPQIFDFYISPTGSDSNDGLTTLTPWAITALTTKASTYAGRRVGLMNGMYRLSGGNAEAIITIPDTASGTSGTHTVVQAVNARQATLTTNNGSGVYPQFGSEGATDTVQINAAFLDWKEINIIDTAGHGLGIQFGHDILIEGCEIANLHATRNTTYTDNNLGGVFFRLQSTPKTNIVIRNCYLHDIYALSNDIQGNNSNGVGDLFGAQGLTIENCTFKNMGVPCFFKGQTKNVVFRYNFVFNCSGFTQAFCTVNAGNNPCTNEVYGNLAYVNWAFGANSSNTQGDACSTARFYNNTLIMTSIESSNVCDFGYMVLQGGSSAQDLDFYNNAIYLDPGFGLGPGMIRFPSGTENPNTRINVWNYNRYSRFNIEDEINSAPYNTLASWQATGRDTASPVVGPLGLVNQAGTTVDDFRPALGSALLKAGKTGGASGGSSVDIGFTGLDITPGCNF